MRCRLELHLRLLHLLGERYGYSSIAVVQLSVAWLCVRRQLYRCVETEDSRSGCLWGEGGIVFVMVFFDCLIVYL